MQMRLEPQQLPPDPNSPRKLPCCRCRVVSRYTVKNVSVVLKRKKKHVPGTRDASASRAPALYDPHPRRRRLCCGCGCGCVGCRRACGGIVDNSEATCDIYNGDKCHRKEKKKVLRTMFEPEHCVHVSVRLWQ